MDCPHRCNGTSATAVTNTQLLLLLGAVNKHPEQESGQYCVLNDASFAPVSQVTAADMTLQLSDRPMGRPPIGHLLH